MRRRWRADLVKAGFEPGPGPGLNIARTRQHTRVEATWLRWEGLPPGGVGRPTDTSVFRLEASHPGLPRSLHVTAEPRPGSLGRVFTPEDVRTHDADFDARVRLAGDPAYILAAFNKKTREISQAFVDAGLVVRGTLHGELRCGRPAVLVAWLNQAADLVQRLAMAPDEVPGRLVRVAERHAEPRARVDAVRHLARLGAHTRLWPALSRLLRGPAEVQAVLQPLLADWLQADPRRVVDLPEVALLKQLDDAGAPVRQAIAERLGDIGTAVSLPALRDLAGAFFERSTVRAAARASLERVLERTHERVGALSVVPEAESGLALVDEDL